MTRFAAFMVGVVCLAGGAAAQSLWDPARPSAPLHADTTARAVGDILTIVIDESYRVENEEDTKFEKSSSLDALISNFDLAPNFFEPLPHATASASKDFDGKATYDKDNSFQTTMTVMVIDVIGNGNLVVEGNRRLIVDGEEKVIRISGLVRPYDVRRDNTVRSAFVANAAIAYEGTGNLTRATNRGWFSHLLDILWPF